MDMLTYLETVITDRKNNPQPGSYTNSLFDEGLSRMAQKVGEEATEVVVAVLSQSKTTQINEISDLFYHTLVLMADRGITLDEISAELERRHRKS